MFKKIVFKGLNYSDLDHVGEHDIKRDELKSFYMTFDFLELIKRWPEIVGDKLAKVTSPLKIKGDCLFILTIHASYSQELSFLSETIKKQIFKTFPELRTIIQKLAFQTQESFFKTNPAEENKIEEQTGHSLHPQNPKYRLLKLEAEKLFNDIEDEEFKEKLISIFIQSKHL
jgi:Dna[CI] antecedent, DciA